MDYFFRCQKSIFNLQNNKCICQGNFFVYHATGPIYYRLFFQVCIYQGYIQNFERNWNNSICIRVNNFAESVNFKISRELSQRKILKLSKLEYYSSCGKVNFSVIHPFHITIYSF